VKLPTLRWRGVLATLSVLATAAPQEASAACKVVRLVEIPVTMSGLVPLVHARINGADVRLIADSGSTVSLLTPAAAAAYKLPVQPAPASFGISGVGGEARARLTTVKTLTFLNHDIPDAMFAVAGNDLGEAAGLLGQSLLGIADVEYDLAKGAIRLMRPYDCHDAWLAYWDKSPQTSVIAIHRGNDDAVNTGTFADAYLNGSRIRVQFDTGSEGSILDLHAARLAGITTTSAGVVPAGSNYGVGRGAVKTWIAPFHSFRIGDEEIRNTRLRIGDSGMDDVDMLLGADFFLSHRIYVANGQGKVYFTYTGGPVFDLSSREPGNPAQK
jgi:predicted aspartyl protease